MWETLDHNKPSQCLMLATSHELADLGLFGKITAREDARCYTILNIPIPGAAADVPRYRPRGLYLEAGV